MRAREQIDRALDALSDSVQPLRDGTRAAASEQLLNVAIEHRLMHAETLAYMLHQLPLAQKVTDLREPVPVRAEPVNMLRSMVRVPAGSAVLGMSRDSGRFGWDNEFGEIRVDVPAFEIDRHMVTNGAFREFIEADGYRDPKWWSEKDWAWKEAEHIEHPAGWSRRDGNDRCMDTCARCSTKCRCRSTGRST